MLGNKMQSRAAEKVEFPAPKGASDFVELAVSLKRYPDTKPELFRKLSGEDSCDFHSKKSRR
jgi:hypothetical protein